MTKVSIITVCKNSEKTIEKTIKSVIFQTYNHIEYIIIDGKSTDNTINIINKYRDKIEHFISEPDSGIYEAMNKGIKKATGDYCLFLNSDDYLYDNKVMERVFQKHYNYDIIYGNTLFDYGNGKLILKKEPEKISYYFLYLGGLAHPGQFIQRKLFTEYGLYNESYKLSSDYELQLRLLVKHNVRTFNIPYTITIFSIISSPMRTIQNSQLSLIENRKAQENIFPPQVLELLDEYHKIVRSPALRLARKLNKIPLVNKIMAYFVHLNVL
ncbi:MAG TPA: glycosyltransferase family 2 protein [Candidatus Eremiobacteraeota bacterium]|nr:glycosyltransferase family 2 protein [Candidatus Eremiobacteraeota bacterium]